MIQDEVRLIPIDEIKVEWEERRPTDPEHIANLAKSIATLGLIHTILVSPDGKLTAGGHRLAAWKQLRDSGVPCPIAEYDSWNLIPSRIAEDFTPEELARIELIENLQHRKLDWREQVRAIWKLHQMQKEIFGDAHSAQMTADLIQAEPSLVWRSLNVYPVLDDPLIAEAETLRKAWNIWNRKMRREKAEKLEQVLDTSAVIQPKEIIGGPVVKSEDPPECRVEKKQDIPKNPDPFISPDTAPVREELPPTPIECANFIEWAASYDGPAFNFIHCDFPYGINLDKSKGQNTPKDVASYDDSPEMYWMLLEALAENQSRLLASSCHIMFWFSQNLRRETEDFFRRKMPQFQINPFLMIWHRTDNKGLLPDPQRYGRRNYETAMLLTSGDRLLAHKAVSLCFGFGQDDDRIHRSQKPLPVLSHFFDMFVDEHSRVLDPTCGSGTSLIAAQQKGAKHIVGLELNPQIAKEAQDLFRRKTRRATA